MTVRECNTPAYLVIECHSLLPVYGLSCLMDVTNALRDLSAVYKRIGLATMVTGFVAGYPTSHCNFCRRFLSGLPASLQGNGIGVSDIPVSLISQRFTDDVIFLPDTPVALLSIPAHSVGGLCLQVLSRILHGLEIRRYFHQRDTDTA